MISRERKDLKEYKGEQWKVVCKGISPGTNVKSFKRTFEEKLSCTFITQERNFHLFEAIWKESSWKLLFIHVS